MYFFPNWLLFDGDSFASKRDLIEPIGNFDENLGVNGQNIGRGRRSE